MPLTLDETPVLAVKPLTYMNKSGNSINCLLKKYYLPAERLIVVYDDIDMKIGKLRIRTDGKSGGQQGLESIIQRLGTEGFSRVKIGVGRPPAGVDPAAYVLSQERDKEARMMLEEAVEEASVAIPVMIKEGPVEAMNRFNR